MPRLGYIALCGFVYSLRAAYNWFPFWLLLVLAFFWQELVADAGLEIAQLNRLNYPADFLWINGSRENVITGRKRFENYLCEHTGANPCAAVSRCHRVPFQHALSLPLDFFSHGSCRADRLRWTAEWSTTVQHRHDFGPIVGHTGRHAHPSPRNHQSAGGKS